MPATSGFTPTQPANAVSAEFSLSEEEAAGIADLASPRVVVHKDYSNHFTWEIEFNHPSPRRRPSGETWKTA